MFCCERGCACPPGHRPCPGANGESEVLAAVLGLAGERPASVPALGTAGSGPGRAGSRHVENRASLEFSLESAFQN